LVKKVQPYVWAAFPAWAHEEGMVAMSCRDTIHLICWYLEGRLSASVESEIRSHLKDCSDCRLVLEAATNTLDRYFDQERAGSGAATQAA